MNWMKKGVGPVSCEAALKPCPCSSFLIFLIWFFVSLAGNGQNTFIVTSSADYDDVDLADQICADITGKCTLRAAIQNANKTVAKDSIHFNIQGNGPFTIYVLEFLPKIVEPVIMDATTQHGYSNLTPQIVLSGEKMAVPVIDPRRLENRIKGFQLSGRSSGSVIRGFVMGGFGVQNFNRQGNNGDLFWGYAILIETENNKIQGNFIGIGPDGKTPFPNFWGISIVSSGTNFIGGKNLPDRNIISGNIRLGIFTRFNAIIEGNYIGTDVTGKKSIGNHTGISLPLTAVNNQVKNNLISGNRTGIFLEGENNVISRNLIGTNYNGTEALSNSVGVLLERSVNNIIGTGNLISGNGIGIQMNKNNDPEPRENKVWGNYIGTDIRGRYAIPNETGVLITKGYANEIGGQRPEKKNIISGNSRAGIQLSETHSNRIMNNFIGTTPNGGAALPNGRGIIFSGQAGEKLSSNNIIKNNLIAGNSKDGILLRHSTHTTISANRIGLHRMELSPLPNGGNGILITDSTIASCIGGREPADANLIGFNHEYGIKFDEEERSTSFYTSQILYNRFFENCKAHVYPIMIRNDGVSSQLLAEQ